MSDILTKNKDIARQMHAKSLLERSRQGLSPEGVKPKAYEVISPDLEDQGREEAGISEVRINKDFLSFKQKTTTKGFHDVKEYYKE